jgi:hypothetical protein
MQQLNQINGLDASLFGQGSSFDGFGSKYRALMPILESMKDHELVVVSDSRDVLINNRKGHNTPDTSRLVDTFRQQFEQMTRNYPGSIVVSAEARCCVSALTHVAPGSYFNLDGSRNAISCSSGEPGCLWNGDDKAQVWEKFMKDLSLERMGQGRTDGQSPTYDDVYLNAGLIAGKVGDLVRIIKSLQLGEGEDDQAVMTDYLFYNAASVVLDYGQSLFGNNRGGNDGTDQASCVFSNTTSSMDQLVHTQTLSYPLFIHSPGGYFECYESIAMELGYNRKVQHDAIVVQRKNRQLQEKEQNHRKLPPCQYGSDCSGGGAGGEKIRARKTKEKMDYSRQLEELLMEKVYNRGSY